MFQFLQEDNGQFSQMRLMSAAWSLGVLVVWVYTCIHTGTMQPIEGSVVGITASLMGAKALQKFAEKP